MRGHIRKRGKNWCAVVYMGRHPQTGKKWKKWYTFSSRREAEAALAQLVTQAHDGVRIPPGKRLTREYLEQWLRDDVEGRLEPSTRAIYRYDVRHYLIPRIGDVPLTRLSAQIIQSCLNRMIDEGLSPATVHQVFRVLRTALATAVRWGLLARNACEFVKRPRIGTRATKPIWDEEEARLFLAEARRSSPNYRLYLTILLTGLRPGEALALRWDDVDLTFARMTVRQKFYRMGREEIWGETKTHKENYVAMPALLVEELRALRDEQAKERQSLGGAYKDRNLVFCQVNGKPLHVHNISQRDFLGVLTRAKLKRIVRFRQPCVT
jgi:integrase